MAASLLVTPSRNTSATSTGDTDGLGVDVLKVRGGGAVSLALTSLSLRPAHPAEQGIIGSRLVRAGVRLKSSKARRGRVPVVAG